MRAAMRFFVADGRVGSVFRQVARHAPFAYRAIDDITDDGAIFSSSLFVARVAPRQQADFAQPVISFSLNAKNMPKYRHFTGSPAATALIRAFHSAWPRRE